MYLFIILMLIFWETEVSFKIRCIYVCVRACTCVYVSACAHMEARRGHQFLPYHSPPIPLRQDLSLDSSPLLSQLYWKLVSFSDPPLQSTSLGADAAQQDTGLIQWVLDPSKWSLRLHSKQSFLILGAVLVTILSLWRDTMIKVIDY